MRKRLNILIPLLVLGLAFIGMVVMNACESPVSGDFLTGNDVDPNNPSVVQADNLLVGVQVNAYIQLTGQLSRIASMWTQQMAGTDRQFLELDKYVFTEDDFDSEFEGWYTTGGLIDIRRMMEFAKALDYRVYVGYGKFYEALFIGTCASIWGDIPHSEAVNDAQFPTPKLDKQQDVYAAVQKLLDEAIVDLGSNVGRNPGSLDLAYKGGASGVTKMIAAAHTLKARFYMHWTEADPSNYQKALAEANLGITSISNNMMTVHNAAISTEWNVWHQFYNNRSTYIRAGKFMVDLMKARNDPRLTIYYRPLASGAVNGAKIAEPIPSGASELGLEFRSPGSSFPLITYEENELIKAECNFKTGDEASALQNLNNVRKAVETKWKAVNANFTYPPLTGLSGQTLLDEILTERYLSLFLQIEIWNDYKRNCFPKLQTYQGQPIPGRLFYSDDERNANPNIPAPAAQPARNANDPAGCQ
jgi:hypothetical protein